MNDVFIKLIENLDSKMTNLATDVSKVHTDIALVKQTLERVEGQTTRTNGRVTKLEDTVIRLTEANATLTAMYSKQSGIFEQNWKKIEENMGGCTREIDELKKKANTEIVVESDIKKINTENGWKFKLAVWATISTIAIAYFTWLFTNTNTLEVKKELINHINNE